MIVKCPECTHKTPFQVLWRHLKDKHNWSSDDYTRWRKESVKMKSDTATTISLHKFNMVDNLKQQLIQAVIANHYEDAKALISVIEMLKSRKRRSA